MPDNIPNVPIDSEGGLRAPPDLKGWAKAWWWFHFLILVKLARLRFIFILVALGLVIVNWDRLLARWDKWTRPVAELTVQSEHEYYCPMHQNVIRDDNKQKCPICFMPLSKRKRGSGVPEVLPAGVVNRVQFTPYRVVQAGIRTWQVGPRPLVKDLDTVGFVEFNERLLKQVAARVKGRIDKLMVNETGRMVTVGQELAFVYSPDLQVTAQNLVDASRASNPTLMKIARDRLKVWGIDDKQLDAIVQTGKTPDHLTIRSPIDGHVLKKFVKEGQYVEEGMPLYDVVDLSTVWIQAQVWEEDIGFLPTEIGPPRDDVDGLSLVATSRAYPGEKFEGKLTFAFPHVDLETRTVVVRFELDNPGHKLRPGTSVNVKVKIPAEKVPSLGGLRRQDVLAVNPLAPVAGIEPLLRFGLRQMQLSRGLVLAVPESAVIDTGNQKIVYREVAHGTYEGLLVELGPRMRGLDDVHYFPVLAGVEEGERIVTAGSFLIDQETRLNPAAGSIYFGGSSTGKTTGASSGPVQPSTPDDEENKIRAELARLPARDRGLAQAQKFCAVLANSRLGSMGVPTKISVLGQPVFLCCKNCEDEALAHPQKTLATLEKLRKK